MDALASVARSRDRPTMLGCVLRDGGTVKWSDEQYYNL